MKVITTVVGELGTNCYLLIDEATREAALIDPADSPDELSALIEREGVTLRYILLTHGHRDHTLAAPAMHKRYPAAAVYIHRLDANGSGIYHYPLEGVIDSLNYYDEGDTLPLGSLTISVLYTPGHTAGNRGVCQIHGEHGGGVGGFIEHQPQCRGYRRPDGNACLPAPPRPAGGRLHRLPRPHGLHHPRAREAVQSLYPSGITIKRSAHPYEARAHWA